MVHQRENDNQAEPLLPVHQSTTTPQAVAADVAMLSVSPPYGATPAVAATFVEKSCKPAAQRRRAALWARLLYHARANASVLCFFLCAGGAMLMLGMNAFHQLPWRGWASLFIVIAALAALIGDVAAPAWCLTITVTILLAIGAVSPTRATAGFGNTSMLTVAALFPVAAGVYRTSTLAPALRAALAKPTPLWAAQLRLFLPMTVVSAFLNNTPVVAMLVPVVVAWCSRVGLHPGKILMPMNNIAVLGGTLSLLGTSTNLVVDGLTRHAGLLVDQQTGEVKGIPVFGITGVGAVAFVMGLIYIVIASGPMLRERPLTNASANHADSTTTTAVNVASVGGAQEAQYVAWFKVERGGPIVGELPTAAASGACVQGVVRAHTNEITTNFDVPLRDGDVVCVVGSLAAIAAAYRAQGLVPDGNKTQLLSTPRASRRLVASVIASSAAPSGTTLTGGAVAARYNAAVVALRVASHDYSNQKAYANDNKAASNVGEEYSLGRRGVADEEVRPGDGMLIEGDAGLATRAKNGAEFAMAEEIPGSQPPLEDTSHRIIAVLSVLFMIVIAACGYASLLTTALIVVFIFIATGCLSATDAARSVDLPILVTIAASFGISNALDDTGAAEQLAQVVLHAFEPFGRIGLIFGVYFGTALLSAVITNNAAVALVFPIVNTLAQSHHQLSTGDRAHDTLQLIYALMLGASSCYATPIAYQTNMMVHGPGGYSFMDWVVFGVPLQLIVGVSSVAALSVMHFSL